MSTLFQVIDLQDGYYPSPIFIYQLWEFTKNPKIVTNYLIKIKFHYMNKIISNSIYYKL